MAFRTQRDLERLSLPPGKAEVFHFDARCPGLSVRIQRTGKPAFVVWYTGAGRKRRRMTIGSVAGTDLDQARRRAADIVNAARDGRDPATERKQARAAAATVFTVADLVGRYLSDHAEQHHRPRTLVETRRALERHWAPLHGLPAADVTRRDISTQLLELARSSGPVSGNRVRAKLSAAYAWAMKAGLVDHNPVVGTVKASEASRSRVLAPDELRQIWQATDDGTSYSAIVRLLALTGCRRTEVGGMAWGELDRERALWVVPANRVKNGRSFEVPLSRQALAILTESPELPERPFVFGRGGRSPFSGWSRCKVRLDARLPELPAWTVHDLRRSFTTLAAEHGLIQPHIIEACLNHVSGHQGGIAGTYNRAAYRAEKAAGLQRWADWLEAVVKGRKAPSNVIPLTA